MKLSRIIAVGAATALVGVSTLVVGGSASAADTYVADIHTSTTWSLSGGGIATDSPAGLLLDATLAPIAIQSDITSTDLTAFVNSLWGGMDDDARFQIHLFTDGATAGGATTLTANTVGTDGLSSGALWTTSNAFETIPAGESRTIAQYEAELATAALTPEITAYGLSVDMGSTATVYSIWVAGDATWFLPAGITATVTPTSITVADVANPAKGVTGVFTGFVANEAVTIWVVDGGSGTDIHTTTADGTGSVTYRYVADATSGFSTVGSYSLVAVSDVSGSSGGAAFNIIANPAVLAATGADFTPAIVSGSLLLLLGAGFMVVARRRAAAHRS